MTFNEQLAIHIASKFYDIELEEIRENESDNFEKAFDSTAIEFKKYADELLEKFDEISKKKESKEAKELAKKRSEDLAYMIDTLY